MLAFVRIPEALPTEGDLFEMMDKQRSIGLAPYTELIRLASKAG